jgi:hypothetical protein
VDFLVTFDGSDERKFRVSLLEFNAEPAIEMTGKRLRWILEELFEQIAEVCVKPVILDNTNTVATGDYKQLTCCLDVDLER